MNNNGTLVLYLKDEVMNEVYFGDKPIAKIQACLSKFRKKYLDAKLYDKNINYDKDLLAMARAIEEQFGYYRFCIKIDPNFSMNAYTLHMGYFAGDHYLEDFSNGLKIYKGSNGFYYDKKAGVCAMMVLNFGLLFNNKYTDREIIGIMLHEIGHNFTMAVLNASGAFGNSSYLTKIFMAMSKNVQLQLSSGDGLDLQKIDQDTNILSRHVKALSSMTKNAIKNLPMIKAVGNIYSRMRGNIKNMAYSDEKFADTFASMYGYSVDVQSALEKARQEVWDTFGTGKKPGFIKFYLQLANLHINGALAHALKLQDEHPEGLTRIKVQIEYLERELRNEALDPKMKIALQNQLEIQKNLIDQFINYTGDPDGFEALRAYYIYLYRKCGGDLRENETDNQALFDAIDSGFDSKK